MRSIRQFEKNAKNAMGAAPRKSHKSTWFNGTQLLELEQEANPWLVEKLIPRVGLSCITGPSDCGKSTLAKQLALCIVGRKDNFLGRKLDSKHYKVCYICTEESKSDVQEILQLHKDGLQLSNIDDIHFLFDDEDIAIKLKSHLLATKVDLIVLDTWSDTLDGDANSMHVVRRNLKPLHNIVSEYGCAALIIHHNVKYSEKSAPDKNKASGSQALEAKLRSLIDFRHGDNSNERVLTLLKCNRVAHSEKGIGQKLILDETTRLLRHTGTEHVFQEPAQGKTKYDVVKWQLLFNEKWVPEKSAASIYRELAEMHPDNDMPSQTWFKENISLPVSEIEKGGYGFSNLNEDEDENS